MNDEYLVAEFRSSDAALLLANVLSPDFQITGANARSLWRLMASLTFSP
jgi:hypothetical protein